MEACHRMQGFEYSYKYYILHLALFKASDVLICINLIIEKQPSCCNYPSKLFPYYLIHSLTFYFCEM